MPPSSRDRIEPGARILAAFRVVGGGGAEAERLLPRAAPPSLRGTPRPGRRSGGIAADLVQARSAGCSGRRRCPRPPWPSPGRWSAGSARAKTSAAACISGIGKVEKEQPRDEVDRRAVLDLARRLRRVHRVGDDRAVVVVGALDIDVGAVDRQRRGELDDRAAQAVGAEIAGRRIALGERLREIASGTPARRRGCGRAMRRFVSRTIAA